MATTPQTVTQEPTGSSLQDKAQAAPLDALHAHGRVRRRHEIPIIVRGEGCYVYDEHGKRYLDGLSALFCVNAGHGRAEIGEAMAAQVRELGFYTNWSYAHPRAIELAERIAGSRPRDLNRVFFTSGGSEAVESALKLCPQLPPPQRRGRPRQDRSPASSPTTAPRSARSSATGLTDLRAPFEPLDARRLPRRRTRTATAGRRTATRCGPPTRSRSGSSSRAPRPSPP